MRVRVLEGKVGFHGGKLRAEGEEFDLEARTHSVLKDDKGEPVVITPDEQFSALWMEVVDQPKRGRPRKIEE